MGYGLWVMLCSNVEERKRQQKAGGKEELKKKTKPKIKDKGGERTAGFRRPPAGI
jgi:hypothetical protein